MPFQKGHKFGGYHPGAGRKKKPERIVREAIDNLRSDIPAIIEQLRLKALNGDKEAAIYLVDRVLGKPKQQMELEGGDNLGANIVAQLMTKLESARREALEYQAPILIEVHKEGSQEEGSHATEQRGSQGVHEGLQE